MGKRRVEGGWRGRSKGMASKDWGAMVRVFVWCGRGRAMMVRLQTDGRKRGQETAVHGQWGAVNWLERAVDLLVGGEEWESSSQAKAMAGRGRGRGRGCDGKYSMVCFSAWTRPGVCVCVCSVVIRNGWGGKRRGEWGWDWIEQKRNRRMEQAEGGSESRRCFRATAITMDARWA